MRLFVKIILIIMALTLFACSGNDEPAVNKDIATPASENDKKDEPKSVSVSVTVPVSYAKEGHEDGKKVGVVIFENEKTVKQVASIPGIDGETCLIAADRGSKSEYTVENRTLVIHETNETPEYLLRRLSESDSDSTEPTILGEWELSVDTKINGIKVSFKLIYKFAETQMTGTLTCRNME